MPSEPRVVYPVQSLGHPEQYYVGLTTSVVDRLAAHNAGLSPHTARYRPWKVLAAVEVRDFESRRGVDAGRRRAATRARATHPALDRLRKRYSAELRPNLGRPEREDLMLTL